MTTECNAEQLEFHTLGSRDVVGRIDGGRITSDAGGLLLREVDHRLGLFDRLADCFTDYRNPNSVDHELTGKAARRFRDFRYRTHKSWSCERRVVGKAEVLPCRRPGATPTQVVWR